MSDPRYGIGETFRIHFVWRLPSDDFLRAIFDGEILYQDDLSSKYVIRLLDFIAGRQESPKGEFRSIEKIDREYWALVQKLSGNKISLAYETDDGRPLWLRLETLTGEHNFFTRLNELPAKNEKM